MIDKKKWVLMNSRSGLLTNLVSYWSFNSDASDALGVNNGTAVNSPTNQAGLLGNGYLFAATKYINVPDNATLSFGNGTIDSPFSFSLWIKPTDITASRAIFAKNILAGNHAEYELDYFLTTGRLIFTMYSQGNNVTYISSTTDSAGVAAGVWNHIVVTYSASRAASGINIYLNASLAAATGGGGGSYVAMKDETAALTFGGNITANSQVGMMDEVGLWSRVLSQAEITYLYNSGTGKSYPF